MAQDVSIGAIIIVQLPHLMTEPALGGNSILVASGDEAQVCALRLEKLQLPP